MKLLVITLVVFAAVALAEPQRWHRPGPWWGLGPVVPGRRPFPINWDQSPQQQQQQQQQQPVNITQIIRDIWRDIAQEIRSAIETARNSTASNSSSNAQASNNSETIN
ncbi:uncharacterized protein LOC129765225 [Toxorhynchites rutilus septentrionalis]|uniref:uncharacterized protein LOC129765225 n=1 Tax=Toxorhynchites rutilus septentrionalis TaxID=329112 RepID=UPI00247AD7C2|nr:uncharacterized protein LOC129765225 [Toxorhynchites rutilus septentrionalis]